MVMPLWYVQYGNAAEEVRTAGPFATEAEARLYATHHLSGRTVRICADDPLPGMGVCPECGLAVWPDEPEHAHHRLV